MALRARLVPVKPDFSADWVGSEVKWASLSSHLFWTGDRRMEAENYLSSGYGLRLAIQGRAAGWQRLERYARVWQPSRLKGILVAPDAGTPFLAATQVFDVRPVPRKWLALERTNEAAERFAENGTIVVTCSGAVGRATLLHAPHERTFISHDLLRITPADSTDWGWVYAYLRSPQARAMMTGAKYGHMIKHLEPSHLNALPIPVLKKGKTLEFSRLASEILELRNKAHKQSLEAERLYEEALGRFEPKDLGEEGFTVSAAKLQGKRLRLEAAFHNPVVTKLHAHLSRGAKGFSKIGDVGFDIWVPGRYKRIPADDGVDYFDSADLLEVSPDITKRFADCDFGDQHGGRVKSGWLLVPCSGQVYGIIGSVAFSGPSLEGQVVSNHVMRLAPGKKPGIRTGYLLTALTHPSLGRPLIKALPFGSSVPELDPSEFSSIEVARLSSSLEEKIADSAEEGGTLRALSDVKEKEIGEKAGALVAKFIAGDLADFVT